MRSLHERPLAHPDVANVFDAGRDRQPRVQGVWVAFAIGRLERVEENRVAGWHFQPRIFVRRKVRLAVGERVVQIHEQRPDPLATARLKVVADFRVVATRVVVRAVVPTDLILDQLHVLTAVDRFVGEPGGNRAQFQRDRMRPGNPRRLAHAGVLIDRLFIVEHRARVE